MVKSVIGRVIAVLTILFQHLARPDRQLLVRRGPDRQLLVRRGPDRQLLVRRVLWQLLLWHHQHCLVVVVFVD